MPSGSRPGRFCRLCRKAALLENNTASKGCRMGLTQPFDDGLGKLVRITLSTQVRGGPVAGHDGRRNGAVQALCLVLLAQVRQHLRAGKHQCAGIGQFATCNIRR